MKSAKMFEDEINDLGADVEGVILNHPSQQMRLINVSDDDLEMIRDEIDFAGTVISHS